MTYPWGEDLWNLLTMFNGMGYMALFVLAVIWARLLLSVLEDALTTRNGSSHKFVHPHPSLSKDLRRRSHDDQDAEDSLERRPKRTTRKVVSVRRMKHYQPPAICD